MLNAASMTSKAQYLECLAGAHAETSKLVADLHHLDETVISSSAAGSGPLESLVNRAFEDLFVPYVDDDRYIETERDWMIHQFNNHLSVFYQFLVIFLVLMLGIQTAIIETIW
jgi:hypothetical protein